MSREKDDNIALLSDKDWRIENLYKIKNKAGELVDFKRNRAQRHFNEHKHTRNITLKSRQLGFTTDEAIDMFDDTLWNKNFDSIFIAHALEPAKDIFDNKIKLAWENFPLQHMLTVEMDSARKLKFDFKDKTFSSIAVSTSGRSGTFQRGHVSEFAKLCKQYPERAKEVLEGTIPAIPTHGRFDIESTAEEAQGLFYEMFWEAWERGEPKLPTQFKAHFYNWQWDEEIEKTEVIDVPAEFRVYQKRHNLTDKEISYYYIKFVSLGEHERNWSTMKREYPTTPEEAFEGAGNKLFDIEKVGLMEQRDPIKRIGNLGELCIYEPYKLGHQYGIGCDVSEGIGKDSSTICVWDFTALKPKVVATYASKTIAPDIFAHEIKNLAEKYEQPLVAVERNNHGHTTLSKLREIYPSRHIYAYQPDRWGWENNLITKPRAFFSLSTAVNEELVDIPSKALHREMRMYDKEGLRTLHSNDEMETNHFDLLQAAVIGFDIKNDALAIRRSSRKSSSSSVRRGTGIRGT